MVSDDYLVSWMATMCCSRMYAHTDLTDPRITQGVGISVVNLALLLYSPLWSPTFSAWGPGGPLHKCNCSFSTGSWSHYITLLACPSCTWAASPRLGLTYILYVPFALEVLASHGMALSRCLRASCHSAALEDASESTLFMIVLRSIGSWNESEASILTLHTLFFVIIIHLPFVPRLLAFPTLTFLGWSAQAWPRESSVYCSLGHSLRPARWSYLWLQRQCFFTRFSGMCLGYPWIACENKKLETWQQQQRLSEV